MPGIKVLIKGLNKVIDFPANTAMPDIEKHIKGNWSSVEEMSGLPMDTASRMERAKYMGFDPSQTFIHDAGYRIPNPSDKPIDEILVGDNVTAFDGLFSAKTPTDLSSKNLNDFIAKKHMNHSEFKKRYKENSDGVWDILREESELLDEADLTKEQMSVIDELITEDKKLEDLINIDEGVFDVPEWIEEAVGGGAADDVVWELQRLRGRVAKGFDVDAVNMRDETGISTLLLDTDGVRNINAAFNPANKDSANLLAGGAAAAVGLGLAGQSEESEAGVVGSIAKEMKRLHPNIKSFITESDGVATLQKVVVDKENRSAGQGTKFMNDFLRLADEKGSTTALTPSADFGGNKKRLEGFYEGFGFKPNKGKNKNFSISETLIRNPKASALAALTANQAQANTTRIDTPSSVAINAPFIDQSNMPSQFRSDLGGIQSPNSPTFINQTGAKLKNLDMPLIGNPLEGVADYLENFGYRDSAGERMKRAGFAALDLL